MSKQYGYCRISTPKQSIERQIRNIRVEYPTAEITQEVFTGTATEGRKAWKALLKKIKPGDTIIFDSVSRLSRDAVEGFDIYKSLFDDGIDLVFLKEPHINTTTYKNAMSTNIQLTGTNVDLILQGINNYLMILAQEQIKIAFEQSEKEVQDLRQRTREGILTAKLNDKQIGLPVGTKLTTKKSINAKEIIRKHCKEFQGSLSDSEAMRLCGISRNTYYKYKRELKME